MVRRTDASSVGTLQPSIIHSSTTPLQWLVLVVIIIIGSSSTVSQSLSNIEGQLNQTSLIRVDRQARFWSPFDDYSFDGPPEPPRPPQRRKPPTKKKFGRIFEDYGDDGIDGFIRNEVEKKVKQDMAKKAQSQKKDNERSNRQVGGGDCVTTNGFRGICLPMAMCFFQYGALKNVIKEPCPTFVNGLSLVGVCCPFDMSFSPVPDDVPYLLTKPYIPSIEIPFRRRLLNEAVALADQSVATFLTMERSFIGTMGQIQPFASTAFFHQAMFGPPDENQQLLNLLGLRHLQISRALTNILHLSPEESRDGLSKISLIGTKYQHALCLEQPKCSPSYKYRTMDGSCNNLKYPLRGKSLTQFTRFLPPNYSDGLSELRVSVVGGRPLPWPRLVSSQLLPMSDNTNSLFDNRWSVIFMQFGQLLDHDITLGSSTRASTGEGLLCCNKTHVQSSLIHPACRPIFVPPNDPFYKRFDNRCLNFVRNAVGPKTDCTLGYREQTNLVTPFIDASMIYGSDHNRSRLVRTFRDGLLLTSNINGREWLPLDTRNHSLGCSVTNDFDIGNSPRQCVFTGDVRVNQQPGLVFLSLIFLREHNRIAKSLKLLNPGWDDETLFQESRRIVAAQMQHIVYNEFLPEALGRPVMKRYGLSLQTSGFCTGYDHQINPSMLNEFSVAAFRWHSLIHKFYLFFSPQNQRINSTELLRVFNNPSVLYPRGKLDDFTRGLMIDKAQRFDSVFVEDVHGKLFPARNQNFGTDLMSLNIQRGRDHAIPTYNQIRKLCNLPPVRHFRELAPLFINPNAWQLFEKVYAHVDDIDFWVAGNHEKPLSEGMLGPTFSCVVGEQFRRIKFGDRFWYENGDMPHSFSLPQLNEIRKVTFSGLLCLNGDSLQKVPQFAFFPVSNLNPSIECSKIPTMDLNYWRGEPVF